MKKVVVGNAFYIQNVYLNFISLYKTDNEWKYPSKESAIFNPFMVGVFKREYFYVLLMIHSRNMKGLEFFGISFHIIN